MAIGSPTYGLQCPFLLSLWHSWPICFLWASLALLLTLHSHGLLLTSLGFPGPITLFSSLGFMGLPLTPYFLCLHYFGPVVAYSHFFIYNAHGYAISLFSGFFKPIFILKAHLFFSWACYPLFLLLGPIGFAIYLPNLCCPCCWAFFFLLGFSKMTLNTLQLRPIQLAKLPPKIELWCRTQNAYVGARVQRYRKKTNKPFFFNFIFKIKIELKS